MSDTPFLTQHDAIPLNRNVVPIPECKLAPALKDGNVIKVVDIPMLGCTSVWLRCQKEAEQWISDCDGRIMKEHPHLINARINAAYAYLFLTDRRFQWAGLAAFASKQVGCGLLHTNELIQKASTAGSAAKAIGGLSIPGALSKLTGDSAQYMKEQLALGNRTLFLDIYPLHRFYALRGIHGMRTCLSERQLIRNHVQWDVPEKLPFGLPFKEILAGFEAIERGDIEESVLRFAIHEQINVLQKVLYDNARTRALLDTNQAAWVTGMPSGLCEEIQLTLSAQCRPKRRLTTMFKKSLASTLWKPDDRMQFVRQAASDFGRLLRTQPNAVEQSIKAIYYGHGVR